MDLNKVMIIGRLTRDPDTKTIPSGVAVTSFTVATNFVWTDANGQKQEKTEYHNIVAWRKLAEICGQYLTKGQQVYIEGRLQTRDWEDQNGVKRYWTEIVASDMIFLARPAGAASPQRNTASPLPTEETPSPTSAAPSAPIDEITSSQTEEEDIKVENIPF